MAITELNAFLESLPARKRPKYERMAWELMQVHHLPAAFILDYLKDWRDPSTWEPIWEWRRLMRLSRISRGVKDYPCVKKLLDHGFMSHMRGQRNILLYNLLQVLRKHRLPYTLQDVLHMNRESQSPLPEREVEQAYEYHLKARAGRGKRPYAFQCRPFKEAKLCDVKCWRLQGEG